MKGDFSRQTFDRKKHYRGVLMQQGRVQVDADWNEQVHLEDHLRTTEAQDVIGFVGAPKYAPGFKVGLTPDNKDLTIAPGRMYVAGTLCEIDPQAVAVLKLETDRMELAELNLDGQELEQGQWIGLIAPEVAVNFVKISAVNASDRSLSFTPALTAQEIADLTKNGLPLVQRCLTYATQPHYPLDAAIPEDGSYLVYLDVWPRHVSAIEDPAIREIALGGPDTATRMQTVWQVKLHEVNDNLDCSHFPPGWRHPDDSYTGKLAARTSPAPPAQEPCQLPPGSGYQGLENQLYRIEIHQSGGVNEATFKWSRDNGSVVTGVIPAGGQVIEVQDLGRSENLGFAPGQWIELHGDRLELLGEPGSLLLIDGIKPAEKQITFQSGVSLPDPAELGPHPRIRRWDQGKDAPAAGITITADWIPLENGLEVRFSGDTFRSGDYWLVPARTATRETQGHIEWPFDDLTGAPLAQSPLGIQHAYCPLALVKSANQAFLPPQPTDCRKIFPPLIEVAEEVGPGQVCCTIIVGNGQDSHGDFDDLQEAIEVIKSLPTDRGYQICLLPGDYEGNFIISGLQKLTIKGCRWQTLIHPKDPDEPVFQLIDCQRIVLQDLDIVQMTGIGIEAHHTANGKLSDLEIRANRIHAKTHAIKVTGGKNIAIQDNQIVMLDSEASRAAIFLAGEEGLIKDNIISVEPAQKNKQVIDIGDKETYPNPLYECTDPKILYREKKFKKYANHVWQNPRDMVNWMPTAIYQGSGGIQIGGGSEAVRIIGNRILGGSWNGITLGDFPEDLLARYQDYRNSVVFNRLDPPAKEILAGQFKSFLYDISIQDNHIQGMGLNGIGVLGFFSQKNIGEIVCVEGLAITNNLIKDCLRQLPDYLKQLPSGDKADLLPEMGFGGIALADCEKVVIRENTIQDNGESHLVPVCGIFMLHGEKVDISDNRILNNGRRDTTTTGGIQPGWRGGIVIALSFREMIREYIQEKELFYHDGIPAVKIHHNIVTQPVGRTISLIAFGPVSIVGNQLTSLGVDNSSLAALLAGCVFIQNLGVSKDLLAAMLLPSYRAMARTAPMTTHVSVQAQAGIGAAAALLYLPSGRILFDNNQVTLDMLTPGTQGAISSQLLISFDDVSYSGNQAECASFFDVLFFDVGLVGATVRSCNNRFQEGFTLTPCSLFSLGFMNTVVGNQATHCLIPLGIPMFVQYSANSILVNFNCAPLYETTASYFKVQSFAKQ